MRRLTELVRWAVKPPAILVRGRTRTPSPTRFTLTDASQSLSAQRRTELLQGRAATDREPLVATGPRTGDFFRILRLLMALADRRTLFGLRLPLPVTARLSAATLLAPLARPITLRCTPSRPSPRRLPAGLATVPRQRMKGRKPRLASLQETDPLPAMPRDLPSR